MKRSLTKIVTSSILAVIMLVGQIVFPLQASADAYTNQVLNYTNPNQFTNGSNPYAFKASDVLNPQILTKVIGCTGITDTLAGYITQGIQKAEEAIKKEAISLATSEAKKEAARVAKKEAAAASEQATTAALAESNAAVDSTYLGTGLGDYISPLVDIAQTDILNNNVQEVTDKTTQNKVDDAKKLADKNSAAQQKQAKLDSFREECINGIAIQLAKNQLTAMTRDTMNWITTGFGGSPFYPRDTDSFMNSLTQYYLQKEVNYFETLPDAHAGDFPWGRDYARGQVNIFQKANNGYDSLKSDLSNYLYNGYTIQNFSTNFNAGGWNAWLGMTQHPQNNPLGFTMNASQALTNAQTRATTNAQNELTQNGGIFNQKKCVQWSTPETQAAIKTALNYAGVSGSNTTKNGMTTVIKNPTTPSGVAPGSTCLKWETVTPGSVILSKVDTYINSPELQLTMVKTLNDALNALFSSLLSKFQNQGLSSLGTSSTDFTTASGGFGSNELFDSDGNLIPLGGGQNSITGGSSSDGGFDLTTDLGNRYVQPVNDGLWNAATNSPALYSSVGVPYHYYTVSVSGSSDITGTSMYWNKGEKAFFNGVSWSKGVPTYIISKKGVLQDQQDYVDTTKDYLNVVGNILPALGKLDYCIPGPNPSWQTNALAAAQNLIDSQTNQDQTDYWTIVSGDFIDQYSTKIDALYGPTSPMQTATLANGQNNPSYLEMAQPGLALTGDILSYTDSVAQAKTASNAIITQENADIAKLNAIKDKVNTIIAAAQKRRTAERAQNGLPAFKQSCLDAEKVTYVVDGTIK